MKKIFAFLISSVFALNLFGTEVVYKTTTYEIKHTGDFVFFGNLKHPSGCAEHLGDNLTGAGDGDDEQIKFDLSQVPAEIKKIAFTVTIYEAEA
ncbi:MAG: TerD family protein, partial [Bacteroidales bacterium]